MKFICKTSKLKEAILKTERATSKQTTLPILENILIKAEKSQILIMATNLEISVKISLSAKIDKAGEVAIRPRILSGFLSLVKSENITGELVGDQLKISSEKNKINIKGMTTEEFPVIPKAPSKSFFQLKASDLIDWVGGILLTVAHGDSMQELNKVLMKIQKDKLLLVSTDRHRLSEVIIPTVEGIKNNDEFEAFISKNESIIIPPQVFLELQKAINLEEIICFSIDQNQLFLKTDSVEITSRLFNGSYPDYQQIIPKEFLAEIKVKKEEIINAVKMASLVVSEQSNEITLQGDTKNNKLTISAVSTESGENQSEIDCEISGKEFKIMFNPRYLLDGLSVNYIDFEEILFQITKEKSIIKNTKQAENRTAFYMISAINK